MSDETPLGSEVWTLVAHRLQGFAREWWDENREELVAIAKEEAQEIFEDLMYGRTTDAKLAIARRMTRKEWVAYRDGLTDQLSGLAARRAKLMHALEEIGGRAARIVGKTALGVLGS